MAQAVALVPQVALVTQYTDDGRDGVRLTTDQFAGRRATGTGGYRPDRLELFSTASGFGNRPVERSGETATVGIQVTVHVPDHFVWRRECRLPATTGRRLNWINDHWVHLAVVQLPTCRRGSTRTFFRGRSGFGGAGTIPAAVVARLLR